MRRLSKITALALLLLITALFSGAVTAHSRLGYPRSPISIICPFGAGGAGDVAARVLASAVKDDFSQPVMVINKPGAAGVVGTMTARMSKPDGYTLLAGRVANNAIIPALNKTIKYKWDDFVCLGLLDLNPLVFVVHKDAPYKTLKDLADDIKAHPGKISFSTAGALNIQEVAAYMLLQSVGVDKNGAVSVPFPSDAAGKNAILGKHVVFGALNLSAVQDQLQGGGNLRALAVTTPARLKRFPDIATVAEAGFPQLENILGWNALFGLKGMPQDTVDMWVAALQHAKADPEWNRHTENMGSIPQILTPEETKAFVKTQVEKFEALGGALDLFIR